MREEPSWMGYKRGSREIHNPFYHVRTQGEGSPLQIRKRVLTRNLTGQPLNLGLPASRTVKNKRLLFQPPSWQYSVISAWTKIPMVNKLISSKVWSRIQTVVKDLFLFLYWIVFTNLNVKHLSFVTKKYL